MMIPKIEGGGGIPRFFPQLEPSQALRDHAAKIYFRIATAAMKTVNLKSDMPSVHEALQRLERELATARREGETLLKVVHGYGSTGAGGDIRIAVQKRLHELADAGQISGRVAHLSSFSYAIPTEGAPSLRSLQGWVAMLPRGDRDRR